MRATLSSLPPMKRPDADSPLIDAGDNDTIDPGATDSAGAERIVDGDGDGTAAVDIKAFEFQPPPVVSVEIDIKPGTDSNPINPMSRGIIPVAILGSESFEVTGVDVTTLGFGPAGAVPAHGNGGHSEDVNDDGFVDLVSHYRTEETGIGVGREGACQWRAVCRDGERGLPSSPDRGRVRARLRTADSPSTNDVVLEASAVPSEQPMTS